MCASWLSLNAEPPEVGSSKKWEYEAWGRGTTNAAQRAPAGIDARGQTPRSI
jgi:hypothetical protein